jgi:hypothetical protein
VAAIGGGRGGDRLGGHHRGRQRRRHGGPGEDRLTVIVLGRVARRRAAGQDQAEIVGRRIVRDRRGERDVALGLGVDDLAVLGAPGVADPGVVEQADRVGRQGHDRDRDPAGRATATGRRGDHGRRR